MEVVEILSTDDEVEVTNSASNVSNVIEKEEFGEIIHVDDGLVSSSDEDCNRSFHEGDSFLVDESIWGARPSIGIKRATEGGISPLDAVKRKVSTSPEKEAMIQQNSTKSYLPYSGDEDAGPQSGGESDSEKNSTGPSYKQLDGKIADATPQSTEPEYQVEEEDEDFLLAMTQSIETAERAKQAEDEQHLGLSQKEAAKLAKERERERKKREKEAERLAKEKERERARREKEAEKLAKKNERERQREIARALKKQQQEEAARAKNHAKQISQQAQGKFSDCEIAVVLHKDLYSSPLGQCISEVVGDSYKVGQKNNQVVGSVRWTNRPMTLGGAAIEGEGVEDRNFLAVIFEAHRFLQLIEDGPEDGDYPALSSAAQSISEQMGLEIEHSVWILNGVHEEVDRRFREHYAQTGGLLPMQQVTKDIVADAITWLTVSESIEVHISKSDQDTAEYLLDLTRALAEAPYKEEITPLHCIQKKKTVSIVEGLDEEEQEVANMFARMLQMIPGVSEKKAIKIVKNYPSLKDLMDEYDNPSITEEEKEILLQGCMSGTNEKVVSRRIYHFFTADDPNEIIS